MQLFSIIIPTRNRHNYLKRTIEYYKAFNDIRIFICDSSADPLDTTQLPAHFIYRHVPGNTFAQKVGKVCLEVDTPYVLMCADDDFITRDGINRSVDFMETNKDYSSAQGNYIAYFYRSGKPHFSPLYVKGYGADIQDDLPSDRLNRFFNSGIQLYYAVHRTDSFREIFSIQAEKIKNLNLLECHIGMMSFINGKHRTLPVFYGCRELIYNSAGKSLGIKDLAEHHQHSEEYQTFLQLVTRKLSVAENLEITESNRKITEVIRNYINSEDAKVYNAKRKKVKRMKQIVPGFIRRTISSFLLNRNYEKNIRSNVDFAKKHPGFPFDNEAGIKELHRMTDIIVKHNIIQS